MQVTHIRTGRCLKGNTFPYLRVLSDPIGADRGAGDGVRFDQSVSTGQAN